MQSYDSGTCSTKGEAYTLTLSVSISASTSPAANSSPSLFFQDAMLPCKGDEALL